MNPDTIDLCGAHLTPLPSGALFWPGEGVLCVSDLHLGKSDRIARRTGVMLPPYETRDTLGRIETDLDRTGARTVICLGDSFDDLQAAEALDEEERLWILRMQAGRRWIWIEGNHDPGPLALGGSHLAEHAIGPITFRHIARPGAVGEVSGHFHPKAELTAAGRRISRRCFLFDTARVMLPAYGTYTGGLRWTAPELQDLFGTDARAAILGREIRYCPMPSIGGAVRPAFAAQPSVAPGKPADIT